MGGEVRGWGKHRTFNIQLPTFNIQLPTTDSESGRATDIRMSGRATCDVLPTRWLGSDNRDIGDAQQRVPAGRTQRDTFKVKTTKNNKLKIGALKVPRQVGAIFWGAVPGIEMPGYPHVVPMGVQYRASQAGGRVGASQSSALRLGGVEGPVVCRAANGELGRAATRPRQRRDGSLRCLRRRPRSLRPDGVFPSSPPGCRCPPGQR